MSKNKAVIDSLIATQQKDPKLYELLRKLSDDLNEVYQAVFKGPLPDNSAENLTKLQADEIEGGLQKTHLPGSVAYEDEANTFTQPQIINTNWVFALAGKLASAGAYFRIGMIGDNDYYFGVGLYWNGSAWTTDTGSGAAIRFASGYVQILQLITGTVVPILTINTSGVLGHGAVASTAGASIYETVIPNNYSHRAVNAAGNGTLRLISLTGNDHVKLGADAHWTGSGHMTIPVVSAGNLPAGGGNGGILCIDSDNNRLCYYANGNRYYLTGIAF